MQSRITNQTGSSPLTRGKPPSEKRAVTRVGLIPAHAGKTVKTSERVKTGQAHPRSRGENILRAIPAITAAGSSPLTRGKPQIGRAWARVAGLIPAHAGKTVADAARASRWWAHPRSRGENQGRRGRGPHPLGLIPAHAGKTCVVSRLPITKEAHPRSRGENRRYQYLQEYPLGSSPLTRGKHVRPPKPPTAPRLIPAHAGKTVDSFPSIPGSEAHPRSRGENFKHGIEAPLDLGSSPLTRGKPSARRGSGRYRGLIPAHAGKTFLAGHRFSVTRAHPRSRGENPHLRVGRFSGTGSSPLTRGKRTIVTVYWLVRGLIPAHAGKTTD